MNTLAHHPAPPPLRLLEPRPRTARPAPAGPVARPTLMQRLDRWLDSLPEPRNRLGDTIRL
jgi:hypothetical protein